MEIEGMIIRILDPVSGTSTRTGNPWKKREYVMETFGQYPRKVKFDVWGDKSDTMIFELQKCYAVQVDVESREFNDRWYTDLKAFSSREIENPMGSIGNNTNHGPIPPVSTPQGAPAPAPQNPFGNTAAPANNPFGANSAPDFTQGDSSEDLPF